MVGEVEDKRGKEGDEKARNDQVGGEEERLPAEHKVVGDVHVLLRPTTAGVENGMAGGSQRQEIPLGGPDGFRVFNLKIGADSSGLSEIVLQIGFKYLTLCSPFYQC